MSGLRALYFDGRTSAARAVEIRIEAGTIVVQGSGVERCWRLVDIKVAPRIGNAARSIDLPDGAACEVRDNDALDRLLPAPASCGAVAPASKVRRPRTGGDDRR